jgi:hypothetical protein
MPSLLAMLGLDASQFKAGLDQSVQNAAKAGDKIGSALGSRVQSALKGVGAAGAGMFLIKEAFGKNMEMGAEAKEILTGASRLNVSAERFQDLARAAGKSGSSIEAVYAAYRKLAQAAVEAEDGDAAMVANFQSLGISVEELKRSSPDQIFAKIAQSSTGAEMTVQRLSALMKTMGKSADELIPGIKSGAFSGTNPFKEDAEDLKAKAQFKSDVSFLKEAAGFATKKLFSFGANGPVQSFFKWQADSLKFLLGVKKGAGAEAPGGADLKAVSKADVEAEQKAAQKKKEDELKLQERVGKLRDDLAAEERRTAFEKMSSEEKIQELYRRRQEIVDNLGKMDEEHRLMALSDVEKLNQEINSQQEKNKPEKLVGHGLKPSVNELQRIGAYAGSAADASLLDTSRRSEQHLSQIKDGIRVLVSRGAQSGGTNFA